MNLIRLIRTVLWGFFGVRRRGGMESDIKAHPGHIILAGIAGAAAFVGILVAGVKTALYLLT